ncbi:hypothetical protein BC835DRAFT_32132 [Cytidiella melzeri]|nr:hypothetical protein BC835DRAFT_32132 [Cytidiella melzeri]
MSASRASLEPPPERCLIHNTADINPSLHCLERATRLGCCYPVSDFVSLANSIGRRTRYRLDRLTFSPGRLPACCVFYVQRRHAPLERCTHPCVLPSQLYEWRYLPSTNEFSADKGNTSLCRAVASEEVHSLSVRSSRISAPKSSGKLYGGCLDAVAGSETWGNVRVTCTVHARVMQMFVNPGRGAPAHGPCGIHR